VQWARLPVPSWPGPVGLVAGGVIGYAAGPKISERLGINKPRHHRRVRHVYR
jgi:hypothetical protein